MIATTRMPGRFVASAIALPSTVSRHRRQGATPEEMKRTAADAGLDDPNKFLEEYWRENDMVGEADCALSRRLCTRATEAKEQFKRIRNPPAAAGANATGEEKYDRRLANNRNSAAATRVHKEILKRLQEYALMEESQRAETLAAKLAAIEAKGLNPRLEKKYEALVEKMEKLEEQNEQLEDRVRRRAAKIVALEDRLRAQETEFAREIKRKGEEYARVLDELRAKGVAHDKEIMELRAKLALGQQPGSPIDDDAVVQYNSLNICPSLFQASQPEKDVVRYGLPRPANTQSQSQDEKIEAPLLKRETSTIVAVLNSETPSSTLRLSLDPPSVGVIESPPSSLHLGVTQESQEPQESQESQESSQSQET